MELLQQIEDSFMATASIVDDRIVVECTGIRTASELKAFMLKNGFNYVSGAYTDGIYELGFSNGGLS